MDKNIEEIKKYKNEIATREKIVGRLILINHIEYIHEEGEKRAAWQAALTYIGNNAIIADDLECSITGDESHVGQAKEFIKKARGILCGDDYRQNQLILKMLESLLEEYKKKNSVFIHHK